MTKSFWIIPVLLVVGFMVSYNQILQWVLATDIRFSPDAKQNETNAKKQDRPSTVPNMYKVLDWKENTLATLFITIKDEVTAFQYSTVKNWPLMCKTNIHFKQPAQDSIRLVLFVNENQHKIPDTKKFIEKSKDYGWIVMNYTQTTKEGTPYLKHLFLLAKENFKSTFYGYSNSDILLGVKNFCKTLKALRPLIPKFNTSIIVIGRRTTIDMNKRLFLEPESVEWAASKEGKLADPDCMEYYISDSRYPWNELKNVVVGRVRIDNYMAYFSLSQKNRIMTIEGTPTITALEQFGAPGNFDNSAKTKKKDKFINEGLYPRGSPYIYISSAIYETRYKDSKTETIGIYDRQKKQFVA